MNPSPFRADVALLLEGSYPFVRGGVSAWVHALIEGLPDFSFSLVHLGAERTGEEEIRYRLPPNVRELQCHYLVGDMELAEPRPEVGDATYFSACERLHSWFREPEGEPDGKWLDEVVVQKNRREGAGTNDFFYSKAAWKQICESYSSNCPDASFQSYFWSVRNMHTPLMKIASIARSIPPTRVLHAVTTGYAGLLGAIVHQRTGRPLILTEHGIYTKERKIELQSRFLRDAPAGLIEPSGVGMEYYHGTWLRMFEGIGRLTYLASDPIISLYELNRQRQIRDGAEAARTRIIPNGVDISRFEPLRALHAEQTPLVLGLIGRIVPIKDIKTFIRTVGILAQRLPGVQGWLIGPEEEDPTYVVECKALVHSLGLQDCIRFMGFQKVEDILPQMGLMALTSISEAFPLVIVESLAAGLPVVSTDVGACRDLIEGNEPEDRALGAAGAIVPMVDHDALAHVAYGLLTDRTRWLAAQHAGITRIERYYQQSRVIEGYRAIYNQRMG